MTESQSKSTNPGDAFWDAVNSVRDTFDKKVAPRMGRGDVRAAILVLLADEPMHGYQIIREIEERSGGRWKPSPGSVYPTLQMLADEGVVVTSVDQDRKVYSLTEAGTEEAATAKAPWALAEPGEPKKYGPLSKAGWEVAQAVTQVARIGTPEQQEKSIDVLNEARRKIYSILSQD